MTDIIIQPNADADNDLTSAVVIDDASLPLSNQDALALGLTLGTTYKARVLGTPQTFSVSNVPATFTAGQWSATTGSGASQISIAITALPAANGSALTEIEYSTDSGATWASLLAPLPALPINATISQHSDGTTGTLSAATSYNIKIRAANANGPAADSDTKAATTGAASAGVTYPSLFSTGVAAANTTTAISLPAGIAANDVAFVVAGHDDENQVSITGGTDIFGTYDAQMAIKAIKLTGGETSIDVVNSHATKTGAVAIAVFRGVSDPIVVVDGPDGYNSGAGTSFYPPAQTATGGGQLLLWLMFIDDIDAVGRWGSYVEANSAIPINYLGGIYSGGTAGSGACAGIAYLITSGPGALDPGVVDLVIGESARAVSIIVE